MMKAVVVLSGGLDSAVNLAWACREFSIASAITFDYGQRAAKKEIENSKRLCERYDLDHEVIPLPYLSGWTGTALVSRDKPLPRHDFFSLDDPEKSHASAKAVWVPNRNGVFLNIAASLAESLEAQRVVVGFNREEAATFPDNSGEFMETVNRSLSYSTLNQVQVVCGTLSMNKAEIVRLGIGLKIPFDLIWSCYEGNDRMCGICESCLRLKRAVQAESPDLLEVLPFAG